ncbi:MAG: class I SAM-dependent methyltransferase [Pseudomonadota bacterium]
MRRVLEPELMEDEMQVSAYAQADFEEPNSCFIELFEKRFGPDIRGHVLDLGCGPGDIVFRFAEKYPAVHVHGVDGSKAMLDFARRHLPPALEGRVDFIQGRLPHEALPRTRYDAVISNSLLHHLPDPAVLWKSIKRYTVKNGAVLVMDLRRPTTQTAAAALVETHAANEPSILQRDFYNSLLAAFEPEEIETQLEDAGLSTLSIEEMGDRHVVVSGTL